MTGLPIDVCEPIVPVVYFVESWENITTGAGGDRKNIVDVFRMCEPPFASKVAPTRVLVDGLALIRATWLILIRLASTVKEDAEIGVTPLPAIDEIVAMPRAEAM